MTGSVLQDRSLFSQPSADNPSFTRDFTAAGAGGEESLMTNVVKNGNMETATSNGGPSGFDYWGSATEIIDSAYTGAVHSGSYAAYQASQGTDQYTSHVYNYYYMLAIPELAYLNQAIYFDFWYNALANPDFTLGGEIFSYLLLNNGASTKLIYYYLSAQTIYGNNDTNIAFYDLRGPLASWINFQRNVSYDFEQAFGLLGGYYINYMYFVTQSPVYATDLTELIIDDVSVTNSTAFDFCYLNGDFEDGAGTYWRNQKIGPASATLTASDKTEGEKALNMTTKSVSMGGYSYQYLQKRLVYYNPPISYYATAPGDCVISFDWKYSDVLNGGNAEFAEMYFTAFNSTFTFRAHYFLGHESGIIPSINYSSSTEKDRAYAAENFNSEDVWNSFSLDLYSLFSAEGITNIVIDSIFFEVFAGYQDDSAVTLLLDDFRVTTYPNGDPSFELDWRWSTSYPLTGWINSYDHNFVNLTTDAHSGNYAVNISSYDSSGYVTVYRESWMPVEENLFTDFWWRIDAVADDNSLIAFDFELNDEHNLVYVLGSSSDIYLTNNSNICYYFVDHYNQTGEWFNLVRNIYADAVAGFGVKDYEITTFSQYCFASGLGIVTSALFDDLYFVLDTTPPEITSLAYDHTPVYYQDTKINFHVTDALSDISEVVLYYWIDATWYTTTPVDLGGGQYQGTIPQADYGAQYNFYINATDSSGNYALEGTHFFIVGDDIDPEATITGPANNAEVSLEVLISVECSDEASGISKVEFYVDSSLAYTDSVGPEYTYNLDTTYLTNGYHNIDVYVYDGAENWAMDYIVINVQNVEPTPTPTPTPSPTPTTETGPLFGGIISLLAIPTLALIIIIYYKKK